MSNSPLPLKTEAAIETHECQCEVHRCKVLVPCTTFGCPGDKGGNHFCATCEEFHKAPTFPGESRRSTHSLVRDGAEQALTSPIETLRLLQQRIAVGATFTLDERDIAVGQLSGVIAYLERPQVSALLHVLGACACFAIGYIAMAVWNKVKA